jgi:hypothetical protein
LSDYVCGVIYRLRIDFYATAGPLGELSGNFGEGESWTVEFSPAFPYQAAFFFRTYQHGSC